MSEILGIARFKFREGQRDEFLRLSERARELVRANEPGTLQYEVYLNADQSEAMVIERYRDSDAAIAHAENLGHMFAAVFDTVELVHGELLGEASAQLKANLADNEEPTLFTPYWST